MRAGRSLSLAVQDLTDIPDCVFQEALEAEVTTVDLSKNKLKEVPNGWVFFLIEPVFLKDSYF